jgi:hypothetical protein
MGLRTFLDDVDTLGDLGEHISSTSPSELVDCWFLILKAHFAGLILIPTTNAPPPKPSERRESKIISSIIKRLFRGSPTPRMFKRIGLFVLKAMPESD